MKATTKRFLDVLFAGHFLKRIGFIEFRCIDNDGNVQQRFHSSVEDAIHDLTKLKKLNHNIYFGVAPREVQKGDKKGIKYITALWSDIDVGSEGHQKPSPYQTVEEALLALDKFPIKPSIIVESGHGLQLYWLLKEPVKVEDVSQIESILKGLIEVLGGDRGTYDISRVMRLPGTKNVKISDKPKSVKIKELHPQRRYFINDFKNMKFS